MKTSLKLFAFALVLASANAFALVDSSLQSNSGRAAAAFGSTDPNGKTSTCPLATAGGGARTDISIDAGAGDAVIRTATAVRTAHGS